MAGDAREPGEPAAGPGDRTSGPAEVPDPAALADLAGLATVLRGLRRREARQREGAELTYRQLAAKAGWSHAVVAAYLTGKTLPPTDRFDTLVRLLGATPGEQRRLAAARDRLEELQRGRRGPASAGRARPGRAAQVPRQLPRDGSGFVGREAELARLDRLLPGPPGSPAGPATAAAADQAVLVVVTGTAGVGKTALAVHWAHRVRDRFPDGQLYLDLSGYAPAVPVAPIEALGQFLRALSVPPELVPTDLPEAAARYRSLLAGRRMLVLLDNAHQLEQVRPLLPAGPGSLALVTSRDRLDGLVVREGARRLTLDVLAPAEAYHLLTWTVGTARVESEPAAVAELTRTCSYLPLALRIAAANLAGRRGGLAAYVAELKAGGELTGLAVSGDEQTAVRTAFGLSYAALPPDAGRLFRLLGAVPAVDLTVGSAAAVAGVRPAEAGRLLDRLAAAHLLQEPTPGRFTCHDLLRQYATELAAAGPEVERAGARQRLYDWYLATVAAATGLLYPEKLRLLADEPAPPAPVGGEVAGDPAQALAWLEEERRNLVLAVRHAAEAGPHRQAWQLADALRGYFHARPHLADWEAVCRAGLAAATADADLRGQSATQLALADVHHRQHQYQLAIEHYSRAAQLAEEAGWPVGRATAVTHLAAMYGETGRLREAVGQFRIALEAHRRTGSVPGQAAVLGNLGVTSFELGQLEAAASYFRQALALDRELGSRIGRGQTLLNLGEVYVFTHQLDQARACLTEALAVFREVGDQTGEVQTLTQLADAYRAGGEPRRAAQLATTALTLARDMLAGAHGHDALVRWCEALALNALAGAHLAVGEARRAIAEHEQALELVRAGGNPYPEAYTELALALAHLAVAEPDRAAGHARAALRIARERGYGLIEERAVAVLGAPGPAG